MSVETPEFKSIERLYNGIVKSEVFMIDGPEIDLPYELGELARAIRDYPHESEDLWNCVGEYEDPCLSNLIESAYWALAHCHRGQWSAEYAALSMLGEVFEPGVGLEDEIVESPAYGLLCDAL